MNYNETKAYSRGYQAGIRKYWPAHKPPVPPQAELAAFYQAALALRNAVDDGCASFDYHDPFVKALADPIEAFDQSLIAWSDWLRAALAKPANGGGE